MLTPEDVQSIANDITDIYADLEKECLQSIANHIKTGEKVTQANVWQLNRLNDIGKLRKDLISKIAIESNKSLSETEKLVADALQHSVGMDIESIKKGMASTSAIDIIQSKTFNRILKTTIAGVRNSINMTGTKALQASIRTYTDLVNTAYLEMVSGIYTYNDVINRAIVRLGKSGIKIVDSKENATSNQLVRKKGELQTTYQGKNGVKTYPIDAAIRRDLTTTINRACGNLTLETCSELGTELVETSWHMGARPEHEVWQGRIFSLNPKDTRYPYFYAPQEAGGTGYGDIEGLCGINCRHNFNPFFESSERSTQEGKPTAEENAKAYKEQQTQRAYERKLRGLKKEQMLYRSQGMQEESIKTLNKIRQTSKQYRQFLNETGRTRVSMFERVRGFSNKIGGDTAVSRASRYVRTIEHGHIIREFTPYGIIDSVNETKGKIFTTRYFYGSEGQLIREITNNDHGNAKGHRVEKDSPHAHVWTWHNGISERSDDSITEIDMMLNQDLFSK